MLCKLIFSFTCLLDLPNYIVWNFLIEDLLKKFSVGIMIVLQSAVIFSPCVSVSAKLIFGNM